MLKKISQALAAFFVILVVVFISFFFWSSSPVVPRSEYKHGFVLENDAVDNTRFSDSGPSLRLMTYNMGYASGMSNAQAVESQEFAYKMNREAIHQILVKHDPDILVMQEVDFDSKRSFREDQADAIMRFKNYQAVGIAPNFSKKYIPFPYWPPAVHWGRVHSGQTIHSRMRIVNHWSNQLVDPDFSFFYMAFYMDRLVQHAVIETPQGKLHVLNAHLEAWDGPTREKQAQQILDLYEEIKNEPVILAGDFNVTLPYASVQHNFPDVQGQTDYRNEKTMSLILDQTDLRLAIDKERYLKNEEAYMTYPSDKPHMRIDFILGNRFIRFIESDIVREDVRGSDHRPVWADFKITQ